VGKKTCPPYKTLKSMAVTQERGNEEKHMENNENCHLDHRERSYAPVTQDLSLWPR